MPYSGKGPSGRHSWPNSHISWIATFVTGRGCFEVGDCRPTGGTLRTKALEPIGRLRLDFSKVGEFTRLRREVARVDLHFAQPTGAAAIRLNSQVSGTPPPKHASAPRSRVQGPLPPGMTGSPTRSCDDRRQLNPSSGTGWQLVEPAAKPAHKPQSILPQSRSSE